MRDNVVHKTLNCKSYIDIQNRGSLGICNHITAFYLERLTFKLGCISLSDPRTLKASLMDVCIDEVVMHLK